MKIIDNINTLLCDDLKCEFVYLVNQHRRNA